MYPITIISDILRQEVDSLAQWLEHWISTPAILIRFPPGTWEFFQTMHHLLVTNKTAYWLLTVPSQQGYRYHKLRKTFSKFYRRHYDISQLIRFARVCNHVTDFNARNKCLTAKLLQQGYRYHKLRKTFSKFYRRHYELISKYNVGLKTLLSEGLSEPEFYGDLVYKLKKLKGINDFSLQFGKIISRYRRIGYNLNVMRQSACLVFNPIMVDNYAAFFNCTPVGRASDSMMAPT